MRIIFHRLAEAEARRTATYLGRQSAGKQARFVAAVDDVIARILANPAAGSPAAGGHRWMRTKRFKYVVYYGHRVTDLIEVFAVAHAGRRPGYWLGRTRRP